jgi:hypothetical protein
MRAFAEHYKDLSFVQAVLAQIPPNNKTPSIKRKIPSRVRLGGRMILNLHL